MSYDIVLLPRRPGQSWEEALEERSPDHRSPAELRGVWARVEARLTETLTGEVESWTADPGSASSAGPGYERTIGELNVVDAGIQVELFHGEAAVSFPYWEREDPQDLHAQVTEAVRVLAEETGYFAYDPQTDRPFDGTFDDEAGVAHTQQLAATDGSAQQWSAPAEPLRQVPFFSGRRRALTYLVIGAIVTLYALASLFSGGAGALTWVALAIGVLDLAIGAHAWRSDGPSAGSTT